MSGKEEEPPSKTDLYWRCIGHMVGILYTVLDDDDCAALYEWTQNSSRDATLALVRIACSPYEHVVENLRVQQMLQVAGELTGQQKKVQQITSKLTEEQLLKLAKAARYIFRQSK